MTQTNLYVALAVVVIVGVVLYYCMGKKDKKGATEGYANIGAIDNLGSLDGSYELLPAPEELVPATHFADMVDTGEHSDIVQQPLGTAPAIRPLERLERLQTQRMLPSTAKSVTPYALDVADISTYSYSVNAPRVTLRNRVNMQADPYRGDIAISYSPDVCMVGKSQYGRDAWRGDGFFSDHFAQLYNKYTARAYRNLPLQTSVKGTILDYAS